MVKDDSVRRTKRWRRFVLPGAIVAAISLVTAGACWALASVPVPVPVVGGPSGARYIRIGERPFLIVKQRTLLNGQTSVEFGIGLESTPARGSQGGGL